MNMRYYLRCLGVPIPNDGTHPTKIFGDNFSVIQSASNPKADLNKKHIALSFHFFSRGDCCGYCCSILALKQNKYFRYPNKKD